MADILVGTTKGLFILEDRGGRHELTGPFCSGWPINHAVGRGGMVLAAGGGKWFGNGVWRRAGGDWAVSRGPFEGPSRCGRCVSTATGCWPDQSPRICTKAGMAGQPGRGWMR